MGAALHGFRWSEKHYDKLDRLVREGLPTPIIARRLGCSSTTVLTRWRMLAERKPAGETDGKRAE
jgi:hypothetical protein